MFFWPPGAEAGHAGGDNIFGGAEGKKGGYVPFFVMERKPSEAALLSLVEEAFGNGISTRKIERLAKSLGIEGLSASQVSEITRELDERVQEFRPRPL